MIRNYVASGGEGALIIITYYRYYEYVEYESREVKELKASLYLEVNSIEVLAVMFIRVLVDSVSYKVVVEGVSLYEVINRVR